MKKLIVAIAVMVWTFSVIAQSTTKTSSDSQPAPKEQTPKPAAPKKNVKKASKAQPAKQTKTPAPEVMPETAPLSPAPPPPEVK
jgi:uncharacterized protein YdeI (BOF family)